MRRTYTHAEKSAALHLIREVGTSEASVRLGISGHTLNDWKYQAQACAYSPFVTRAGRRVAEEERALLLEQLIHEQELEMRFITRRTYRHNREMCGGLSVAAEVLFKGNGYLTEWLDPTFDEVVERAA